MVACYVCLEILGIAGPGGRGDYEALHACFKGGSECVYYGFMKIVEIFYVFSSSS